MYADRVLGPHVPLAPLSHLARPTATWLPPCFPPYFPFLLTDDMPPHPLCTSRDTFFLTYLCLFSEQRNKQARARERERQIQAQREAKKLEKQLNALGEITKEVSSVLRFSLHSSSFTPTCRSGALQLHNRAFAHQAASRGGAEALGWAVLRCVVWYPRTGLFVAGCVDEMCRVPRLALPARKGAGA